MIYQCLSDKTTKKFAVLIDPDKHDEISLPQLTESVNNSMADFILIGGSLISELLDEKIKLIKTITDKPIVLFPGSVLQLSSQADGILLLSLISGRNPEFLIGNHVVAAPFLKKSGLEIIATGYMLIDGGEATSVEYVSNTRPIPAHKIDIAIATAQAAELLGMQCIYLEAGSGAANHVPFKMVKEIRKSIDIPIIVGGGINSAEIVNQMYQSGANMVVTGTAFETDSRLVSSFTRIKEQQ
jgi:putative glycerol-1-phosphate prenyltransferase